MNGHETSAQVIQKINQRDTAFRAFFVILMFAVLLALFTVIYLQARALQEFRGQSAERGASLKTLAGQNLDAAGRTNSYIQCLARFFTEADRVDLKLTDLDKCSYERGGNAVPGVDVTPTGSPAAGQTTAPSGSAQQVPTTTPDVPVSDPEPAPAPSPEAFEVLGIPVCIPFTSVCIMR